MAEELQKLSDLDLDLGSGQSYWCAYQVGGYADTKLD